MGKRIVLSTGNLLKLVGLLYAELAMSALSLVPATKRVIRQESCVLVRSAPVAADAT